MTAEESKGRVWTAAKTTATAVTILGGLAAALFGVVTFVDNRVDKRLADPLVLRKIAAEVRPALIFDSQNRILADQGGLEYIAEVKFTPGTDDRHPATLVVTPRAFLPVAPLLESLDVEGYQITAERGPGIAWVYTMQSNRFLESGVSVERFRL